MIGPSTEPDPDRSSGTKRKAFDDLDLEDFCNQVYPDGKKQYISEFSIPIEELSSQIIQSDDLCSSDVTKLEVLVVDEMWANGDFDQHDLADFTTEDHLVQGQNLQTTLDQTVWRPPEEPKNSFKVPKKPAPMSSPVEDQENGNLSWLLNFKLDSFIDAADDKCKAPVKTTSKSKIKTNSSFAVKKLESVSCQNCPQNKGTSSQKKPPFTYTELIEHALQEKGELTVSAIYQWISDHFPYYKSNDDRWKNSVRHNLSINPHFRKGSKAPHGAGHLWAIANQDESKSRTFLNGNNFIPTIRDSKSCPEEIAKEITEECQRNLQSNSQVPFDEVAAATASIVQKCNEEEETEAEVIGSFTLEHSAERILSGLKRDVEVQYLIPMMVSENGDENHQNADHCKETAFLNPVSKEVVAEECGLIEEGYLVTDLNPAVLGLNLAEQEIVSPENLFGEELSFQFYELTSPSQLQSA